MGWKNLNLAAVGLALWLGGTGLTGGAESGEGAAAGRDLYQRLACHGCHTLDGGDGKIGPLLDGVGRRLARENLETQLLTPRKRRADSRMPSFAFIKPAELQSLLDYLQSLQ